MVFREKWSSIRILALVALVFVFNCKSGQKKKAEAKKKDTPPSQVEGNSGNYGPGYNSGAGYKSGQGYDPKNFGGQPLDKSDVVEYLNLKLRNLSFHRYGYGQSKPAGGAWWEWKNKASNIIPKIQKHFPYGYALVVRGYGGAKKNKYYKNTIGYRRAKFFYNYMLNQDFPKPVVILESKPSSTLKGWHLRRLPRYRGVVFFLRETNNYGDGDAWNMEGEPAAPKLSAAAKQKAIAKADSEEVVFTNAETKGQASYPNYSESDSWEDEDLLPGNSQSKNTKNKNGEIIVYEDDLPAGGQ